MLVKNLKIGYQNSKSKTCVQENINLEIKPGKITVLIGINGIGKSTLLKTITGIIPLISGEIIIENNLISTLNAIEFSKKISVVLTEKIPPSQLSVFELVALGRQPYTNWLGHLTENDLKEINFAIQCTEIENLLNKKNFEISDGQLQKVLIARALAQNTPYIFLDEPTTHLDWHHKIMVFKLLKKIAAETRKYIILSTHDLDLALSFADSLIVMKKNEVIQGSLDKLIQNNQIQNLFEDSSIQFNVKNKSFQFVP